MYIRSLTVTDFRNFSNEKLEFCCGTNLLFGNNGSGKTNILEALFVLCLGRSHRGASDSIMVNHDADTFRVEGDISIDEQDLKVAVAFRKNDRKKITIDKVAVKISELYTLLAVVSASPEDSEIISGSPSLRRTFIDMHLSQLSSDYLARLSDYHKVLIQKNAALKADMDPSPFNELLAVSGARICVDRMHFLNEVALLSEENYRLATDGDQFRLSYRPSIRPVNNGEDLSATEEIFRQRLQNERQREAVMRTALVGPHRDDIFFELNSTPARYHGSQGEWRTAAISLKLAVYDMLKRRKQSDPILLLDEIFAELDGERERRIIESFGGLGQLFLTTAGQPPEIASSEHRSFRIDSGRVVGVE